MNHWHLINSIIVAAEIILHLYLLHRLPKRLQIILLNICEVQITFTLTEVHHMCIQAMVSGMVVIPTLLLCLLRRITVINFWYLFIIIKDIMYTILILETIVGSLLEATILKIEADYHQRCLFIALLHFWGTGDIDIDRHYRAQLQNTRPSWWWRVT